MNADTAHSHFDDLIRAIQQRIQIPSQITDSADAVHAVIHPPASAADIEAAESDLGFALPPLLRELLTTVGNGGFGPGYGLLGVAHGALDDLGKNMLDLYAMFREPNPGDPAWQWPEFLLPVCHLGCAMYVCIDCSKPNAPTIWFEPNPRRDGDPMAPFLIPAAPSLEDWLWYWVRGQEWAKPSYDSSGPLDWLEKTHGP